MSRPARRSLLATAATAALAVGLTACSSSPQESADSPAADQDPVVVLHAPISYEPLYIAEQEGYFEEAGVEVDIRPGGAPQDNLAQAMGGSADIITAAWDTMAISTAEGMPVSIVAGNSVIGDEVDTSGLVVRADSGITSLKDLQGSTVAFDSVGAGGTVEFYSALAEAGLTPEDVTVAAVPYAGMGSSLEQGQVAAVFPSEPFYTPLATDPKNTVLANPVRETRSGVPVTLWAATDQWLQENPEQAEAFVQALEKAVEFYEDPANLEAVKKIRAEVTQVPVEEVSEVLPPLQLAIDETAGQAANDQLHEFDRIDRQLPVSEFVWEGAPRT